MPRLNMLELPEETFELLLREARDSGVSPEEAAARLVVEALADAPGPARQPVLPKRDRAEVARRIREMTLVPLAPDSTPVIRADRDAP